MYENILFEKKDGVAYLTLNRPDRLNALNSAVLKELDDALAAIDGDAEIRVLVVRGAADKAGTPPIALHPYATHPDKAWKEAYWRQLMELFESRGIPWIVIGRGSCMEGIPASRNFTNRTSLRETCALLKSSSLLITGDSAESTWNSFWR